MDVSPGGELFVAGGNDGELKVGDVKTGEVMVCIHALCWYERYSYIYIAF